MNHVTRFARLVLLLALVGALGAGRRREETAQHRLADDADDLRPPPDDDVRDGQSRHIAAAETAEAAQAAYDAVKDDVTATQGESLQLKVNVRIAVLEMMDRVVNQKMALMTAVGMIDTSDLSTQAAVDAARTAIAGLRQALADAADVSEADKMMYMSMLTTAVEDVDMAQGGIDTDTRRMNQMTALSDASTDLQAALAALSGSTPTQAQLDAANSAIADMNAAIMDGADLTDTEKAPYVREAANAAAPIQTAQMAFYNAEDDAEDAANEAMAVTAAKLYQGISAQMGDGAPTSRAANDRDAAYNDAGDILVSIGDAAAAADAFITLSEDEDTMVADNHGWEGKRYTDPAGGDMVEAIVYSNVEDPEMGRKFGSASAVEDGGDFEYQLVDGELNETNGINENADKVVLSSVTRTAGTVTFEKPDNAVRLMIPGSFHGVPGTYNCMPAGDADSCSAKVEVEGFTFTAADIWTFTPGDPDASIMDGEATSYASYGWWLRKAANDGPFTASAFVDEMGAESPAATGLDQLNGTATYMGGAAGKYALSSSLGGTNDAGHFTARAMLEANFNTDRITGIIDDFIGADDQSRNWSVKLNNSNISNDGGITGLGTETGDQSTQWTIDGTAADAAGQWSGTLRETDADGGVPKVATGTFYSQYGLAGRMVGGFGVNAQ